MRVVTGHVVKNDVLTTGRVIHIKAASDKVIELLTDNFELTYPCELEVAIAAEGFVFDRHDGNVSIYSIVGFEFIDVANIGYKAMEIFNLDYYCKSKLIYLN